jgi:hypothetical protein
VAFGQQVAEPQICRNPSSLGTNYITGGAFDINKYSCLSENTVNTTHIVTSPSGIASGSELYYFNFTDGSNVSDAIPNNSSLFGGAGVFWVLQEGKIGIKNAISCNSIEVIQTHIPEIEVVRCGNLSIKITIKNTTTNTFHNQYLVDWGDGQQEKFILNAASLPFNIPTHQYTQIPTSPPSIIGKYVRDNAVVCSSLAKNISLEDFVYISELNGLNSGKEAQLVILQGETNKEYAIQYKKVVNSTWTDYGEIIKYGVDKGEIIVKGLDPTNEYCFRVKEVLNTCGLISYTNEVCTIVPRLNLLASNSLIIDWNVPNGVSNIQDYKINLKDSDNTSYATFTSINNSFTHSPLKCKSKYTFKVSTAYNFNKYVVSIKSPDFSVDTETAKKLPPILVGAISIEKPKIFVNLAVPDSFEPVSYTFYRAENNSENFKEIANTSNSYLVESGLDFTKNQYCYKVDYTNICGVKSELSPSFCSVFSSLENTSTLQWTPIEIVQIDEYISSEKEYIVQMIDNSGGTHEISRVKKTNFKFSDNALIEEELLKFGKAKLLIEASQDLVIDYYGTVQNIYFSVHSNEIEVFKPIAFYLPNAFTPDNTGPSENEVFMAKGEFLNGIQMLIYDKWGSVIFESNDLNIGWTGKQSDGLTPCPIGEYSYKITCEDIFGQKSTKIGSIALLK